MWGVAPSISVRGDAGLGDCTAEARRAPRKKFSIKKLSHHEAHEGHEGFGLFFDKNLLNFVLFAIFVVKIAFLFLVAAKPRWNSVGESRFLNLLNVWNDWNVLND